MRQPPTNICPLFGNPCLEDNCAWWCCSAGECAITSIADSITELADSKEEADGN